MQLETQINSDIAQLARKNREYGASWRRRGGVGAFMMLTRKWDRLEAFMDANKGRFNSLREALDADNRQEGIGDDIGDLRRYLMLCEAWMTYARDTPEYLEKLDWPNAYLADWKHLSSVWQSFEQIVAGKHWDIFSVPVAIVREMRLKLCPVDTTHGASAVS